MQVSLCGDPLRVMLLLFIESNVYYDVAIIGVTLLVYHSLSTDLPLKVFLFWEYGLELW